MEEPDNYWELVNVNITGIERVGRLIEQGRVEEARNFFISAARAVFSRRWPTKRTDHLRRLGEELDTRRYPQLEETAHALRNGDPEGPPAFLDYLRDRPEPDISRHVVEPQAAPEDLKEARDGNGGAFQLWKAWTASGDPEIKTQLDSRIERFLDPYKAIEWGETNYGWVKLVCSALHHGGLEDETLCKLIMFGIDYAEYCDLIAHHVEPAQTSIGGNWIFYWVLSWLSATCVFPEFRRSPALRHAAVARFDDEISRQVMPDGSMIEGSPGYQNCCLRAFGRYLDFFSDHDIEVPDRIMDAIRRMVGFNIGILKPDWCTPMFGDSQDEQFAVHTRTLKEHLDMPVFDWALSEGEEGHPPEHESIGFECIGYYALRNGWEEDSLCMVFDGGRMGQAHCHEDKLNFELHAYGREFIVDPGVYSYSHDPFRIWLLVAQSHNTILVDGAGQCRWHQDRDKWYSHLPVDTRWEPGETFDVVEAEFSGPYEGDIGPFCQRRRVVFHKGNPPFWWITDRVEGSGEHTVTELFHFAHDIPVVEPVGDGVQTRLEGGPNLALLPIGPARPEIERYRGETDPFRGWVSPERNAKEPAWEVHFTGEGELPLRRDFLFLPWPEKLPETCEADLQLGPQPRLDLGVGAKKYAVDLPEG